MEPITLIKGDPNTNKDKLVTVKAAALVERLAQKVLERKVGTLRRKLGDSESQTTN